MHLAPGVWIGKTPPAGCPGGAPDPEISRPTPVPAINGPGLGLLTALLAGVCGGSLRRRRQRPN
ncbi:hypothetical protein [Diaphorobacter aerolatus]|uniref:Uncharacterized protein n=1 Tax=Diaphorobacter aerolatus TaxID=1288495 RepID=A0A7H0GGW5_9BURK|nr:hypothetical protein [Diaphorobacter aerolatus]QNP47531.1 hypothetical protein H9K75_14890 [Diaphorobacter aerolatus]